MIFLFARTGGEEQSKHFLSDWQNHLYGWKPWSASLTPLDQTHLECSRRNEMAQSGAGARSLWKLPSRDRLGCELPRNRQTGRQLAEKLEHTATWKHGLDRRWSVAKKTDSSQGSNGTEDVGTCSGFKLQGDS